MPTRENTAIYAMYVIGEVESGWDWTAVNPSDPITLGMMQWYGQRAANLLASCKDADASGWADFAAAAPDLAAAVEAGHSWDWWAGYYITYEEGNAWKKWATSDAVHQAQQTQWGVDFDGYVDTLTGMGLSLDRPQTMVYAMAMYHQSPRHCGYVIGTCSGSATLENMHATCLNDSVLGIYTNRYNTVYQRLAAWDGESAPPDFGQIGDLLPPGGNDGGISRPDAPVSRVELVNGDIVLWGLGGYEKGLYCKLSGPNIWLPAFNNWGADNPGGTTGGGTVPPGSSAGAVAVQWMADHLEQWAYGNGGGRLDPMASGYTDCSGGVWCAYHYGAGVDLVTSDGTAAQWTGTQSDVGVEVWRGTSLSAFPWDDMAPGDIVLMTADPGALWAFDAYMCDAQLYTGTPNQTIGCGYGPLPRYLNGSQIDVYNGSVGFMVRRVVTE